MSCVDLFPKKYTSYYKAWPMMDSRFSSQLVLVDETRVVIQREKVVLRISCGCFSRVRSRNERVSSSLQNCRQTRYSSTEPNTYTRPHSELANSVAARFVELAVVVRQLVLEMVVERYSEEDFERSLVKSRGVPEWLVHRLPVSRAVSEVPPR